MQDPPQVLHQFVEQWEQGHQVVYAVRTKRKENPAKKAAYWTFYRALRRLADIEIPLDAGDFCLMDRQVVDALVALPEKDRFLRGLRTWVGFDQVGVVYERPARHAGEVKYTPRKLVKLALSGLLAFTSTPLRFASYMGFLTAACGIVYLLWAVTSRIVAGSIPAGWTSIIAVVADPRRHPAHRHGCPRRVRRIDLRGEQAAPSLPGRASSRHRSPDPFVEVTSR